MRPPPRVTIVTTDIEREREVSAALSFATADRGVESSTVLVEDVESSPETVASRIESSAPTVLVVAVDDRRYLTELIRTVVDEDGSVPTVVYSSPLSHATLQELLAIDNVEFVPRTVAGASVLLSDRIERVIDQVVESSWGREAPVTVPAILDDVSEGVFAINPDWHVVYCNRAAEPILGEEREGILGRRILDMPNIDEGELLAEIDRSMNRHESIAFETGVNGEWYDVRTYPSASGVSVFARNITDTYERNRLFRAVFEGAMDAMLIADDEGRYVDVNDAAVDLFGVESDSDLIGRTIPEFAPAGFDVAAMWERFRESDNDRGLFPLVRGDGDRRVVEFAATPNVIDGRHLSVIRDVTEHDGYPSFASILAEGEAKHPPR